MKKMALLSGIGALALMLGWGIIHAQESPHGLGNLPSERMNRHDVPGQRGGQMRDMGSILEQGVMVQNPKVKEELKRHREAMTKLAEKIRLFREKNTLKSNITGGSIKGTHDTTSSEGTGNEDSSSLSHEGDNPDAEKTANPVEAKINSLAADITAEMSVYHKNLAEIIEAEKDDIVAKVADFIAVPRMHNRPGVMGAGEGEMPRRQEDMPKSPQPQSPESHEAPE